MRRTLVAVALVLTSLLVACAPPPPPSPAPLPGSPNHVGKQRLSVAILDSRGDTVICELWNEVDLSISTTGWYAVSHTYLGAGPCTRAMWIDQLITMTCWVGSSPCGGPWVLLNHVKDVNEPVTERGTFTRVPPHLAKLTLDFSAVLQPGSNPAFRIPVSVVGTTPTIRCNTESCHFV